MKTHGIQILLDDRALAGDLRDPEYRKQFSTIYDYNIINLTSSQGNKVINAAAKTAEAVTNIRNSGSFCAVIQSIWWERFPHYRVDWNSGQPNQERFLSWDEMMASLVSGPESLTAQELLDMTRELDHPGRLRAVEAWRKKAVDLLMADSPAEEVVVCINHALALQEGCAPGFQSMEGFDPLEDGQYYDARPLLGNCDSEPISEQSEPGHLVMVELMLYFG